MNQTPLYVLDAAGEYRLADAETVIAEAKRCVAMKFQRGVSLATPDAAKEALQLQLCEQDYEIFGCLFLDQKNRLIKKWPSCSGAALTGQPSIPVRW